MRPGAGAQRIPTGMNYRPLEKLAGIGLAGAQVATSQPFRDNGPAYRRWLQVLSRHEKWVARGSDQEGFSTQHVTRKEIRP